MNYRLVWCEGRDAYLACGSRQRAARVCPYGRWDADRYDAWMTGWENAAEGFDPLRARR